MSDLSQMSTSDLQKENTILISDEKKIRESISAINSITAMYNEVLLGTTALTGLSIITFAITAVTTLAFYLFSDVRITTISIWSLSWVATVAIAVFTHRKAFLNNGKAAQYIRDTDNRELSQLKTCESNIAGLLKRNRSFFAVNSLLATISVVIFIIGNLVT